jgi:hypothetical protein
MDDDFSGDVRLVSIAPYRSKCCRIEPQVEHPKILVEMMMTTVMEKAMETTERMIGEILDVDRPKAATAIRISVLPSQIFAMPRCSCAMSWTIE